jgi:uncharacterized RDD family membrane protein YckC
MTSEPPPPPPGSQPPPGGSQQPPSYQPPPPPPGGGYPQQAGAYEQAAGGQLADFWPRLGAFAIDFAILFVANAIISLIFRPMGSGGGFLGSLLQLVVDLGYWTYFFSEAGQGQTLGMRVLGVRVVKSDGSQLSYGRALGRAAMIAISLAICLIPAIVSLFMAGLSQRRQAIHDLVSDTLVVNAARA